MSNSTALESGASAQAYQLLVELEWVQPKVWRRLLVPTTIDLPLLHAT
ncbi:MAG: plasmid pRiA4b ORF-3 family protein, partial [Bacteriovorax sp.]|nr:plasmid pRiA4b ORF-3 family protein [Rhizobacter sp.]